ncbi:deoxycytidylate deaminase [Tribonema minus]|uniref:dCMP deaminase n=1 Tax=Tribonema minus TaxID=303371 RepID=A0A835YZN4_9STRA|nr:deoxycytidylate deaminase [Tribonema minus]
MLTGEEATDELQQQEAKLEPQAVPAPTWAVGGARKDYLHWDDYFMSVAFLSAMRSKDPSTQVGACIVNPDKRIVGIGYNGFPAGCSDERLPWARAAPNELDTKYPYVCHAEMNAILNKNAADVRGCTIYVALFPCADCAKLIIQSGIAHVVYVSDKYRDAPAFVASRRMLDLAGVRCRRHVSARRRVTIDFGAADAATAEEAGTDGTL